MPSNSAEAPFQDSKPETEQAVAGENLALLYQGLFTGIVRMRGDRQHLPNSETFRRRTKTTLQEVERIATAAGYDLRDVTDTHFAVVALLDSAILNSRDPARTEWERKTLQQELFGQTDAGEVFFEKLEQFRSRRDSEQLSDILEVYLLCLLLGFEGRYAGGRRGELEGLVESLRMRIDFIRGRNPELSPSANLPASPDPKVPTMPRRDRLRLVTLGVVILTILCYLVLRWNLVSASEEVRGKLL